jgi:hypothetical protein
MHPSNFDNLTRSVGQIGTRRRLLARLLVGAPLLGALAVVREEEAAAERPIDRVQQRTQQRNRKQRNTKKHTNQNNDKHHKHHKRGVEGSLCGGRLCAAEGEVCCGPIAAPEAAPAGSTNKVFVCCPTTSCCGPNMCFMACCTPGQICHARSPISVFCEG